MSLLVWTIRSPFRSCLHRRTLFTTPPARLPRVDAHRFRHLKPKRPASEAESAPDIHSTRELLAEVETETVLENEARKQPPRIRNQVLFFLAGSALAFGVAARCTNEDTLFWSDRLSRTGLRLHSPTDSEMIEARTTALAKSLVLWYQKATNTLRLVPEGLQNMVTYGYVHLAERWVNAGDGKRTCYAIVAANGIVWAAWVVPRLGPFMMRHFTHHPLSGRSHTMLTSVFSHHAFFHLLFNCMALTSFGTGAALYLHRQSVRDSSKLRESRFDYHFIAFYVSAGIFASLVSHVAAARILYPRLAAVPAAAKSAVSSIAPKASTATTAAELSKPAVKILPSLGASGAVYAAVAVTALAFPDSRVSLILLPGLTLPISWGVGGMVALDILGVLRGWKLFDHYAHLGGAAFGAAYWAWGADFWDWVRREAMWGLPPGLASPSVWEV